MPTVYGRRANRWFQMEDIEEKKNQGKTNPKPKKKIKNKKKINNPREVNYQRFTSLWTGQEVEEGAGPRGGGG